MVWRLRAFRPVAERHLPGTPNAQDPPLTVIVFRRGGDFRRAVDGAPVVAYMQPSFTESLMVVGPDPQAFTDHESLLHEYVHYLLRTRTDINIPIWFDEGLASMLSATDVAARQAEVGRLPDQRLEQAIRESRLSLRDVLDAEDVAQWHPQRRVGFYAWSWLLVHRLMLGHLGGRDDLRPALEDFLRERYDSLPDALDLSPNALEHRIERYMARRPPSIEHPLPRRIDASGSYRCLDDSERARRLSLAIVPHNPELAVRQLRRRLRQDDGEVELWTALSLAEELAGDREASLEAARRARSLDPENVSAAVRLATALVIGCVFEVSEPCRARWQESVPLLRESLRRDPVRQDAIFTLGLAYLYSGRPGDALNYLRIAHQRQPWAAHVNYYLGESYRLVGDVRAREHLMRARQWSSTELWRTLAEAGLELLESG